MMEWAFEIGDEVLVLDGADIPNYTANWNESEMGLYVGHWCTIAARIDSGGRPAYRLKESARFIWDERGLSRYEPEIGKKQLCSSPYMNDIFNMYNNPEEYDL